ncbi:MAG: MCE family protein [Bacteroidales bacterium]|nr:MCE family protein [Bacteroidales bacterium]
MNHKQKRSVIVGLFVILGLTIFIVAIYLVGKKENLFGSAYQISAIFQDVKGLREGDRVRLSGIDIGTVNSLGFLSDNRVHVQMNIDKELVKFVKKDSRATIVNEGLMGSKVVMILPGTMHSLPVHDFDTLQTIEQVDMDDIMQEVKQSSENITVVTGELISITQKINRGDGIFGKIFTDTTFTGNLDASSRNVTEITRNLIEISEKVKKGQGIVGKLFGDTLLSAEIDSAGRNIDRIASNITEITKKINEGEGIIGTLFTDTILNDYLYRSSKNLEYTTYNLMELTARLNNDSSALNMLINDPTFADSLEIFLNRMNAGVDEVTRAAEAIRESGLIRMFSKDEDKRKD